jgi:hypothetical protein
VLCLLSRHTVRATFLQLAVIVTCSDLEIDLSSLYVNKLPNKQS